MPEEISILSPDKQMNAIIKKSFIIMFGGLLLVLIFSDPMVDVMNELGICIGIPVF
jgi:hypothetical protein